MRKLTNKKGFTLIELVIVVAVLAILAVIAVPAVAGFTEKAKTNRDLADLAVYQAAIERQYIDGKNVYPDAADKAIAAIKLYTNKKSIEKPAGGNFYYVTKGTIDGNKAGTVYFSASVPANDTTNEAVKINGD